MRAWVAGAGITTMPVTMLRVRTLPATPISVPAARTAPTLRVPPVPPMVEALVRRVILVTSSMTRRA